MHVVHGSVLKRFVNIDKFSGSRGFQKFLVSCKLLQYYYQTVRGLNFIKIYYRFKLLCRAVRNELNVTCDQRRVTEFI